MQRRRLGQTDIEVSALGLGTVKFGRNQGVKYPQAFSLPTDVAIADLLSVARDLNINLLDTAPAYGSSEERLGRAIKGDRQAWIITSKAGENFIDGKSFFDFSPAAIEKSIEQSLKRLQTDYLDILLIHSNGEDEKIIEQDKVFSVLTRLKESGKIRAYGMSTKTIAGGITCLNQSDLAMVSFNPAYTAERQVIAHAHRLQKGILIKKALNSGHLSAKESLQFVLAEPGVTSIIVGTLSPQHLQENVAILLGWP